MHGDPRPTAQDVLGSINGLPYTWGLLLAGLASEARDAALRFQRRTTDRLADLAGSEEDLAEVAPLAAAASRHLDDATRTVLLAELTGDLLAAGRAVAATGAGVARHVGRVDAINVSGGGVPKVSIERTEIGPRGLPDDHQTNRRHHGKPMQAVCLYATEVIDALRAEGHPISVGAVGENLTLSGIAWDALRPGTRLEVGSAELVLSAPATPCAKNAQWFADGDFQRMSHDRHPGWSRWYAWVTQPGEVATGDAVVVEPV